MVKNLRAKDKKKSQKTKFLSVFCIKGARGNAPIPKLYDAYKPKDKGTYGGILNGQ